ncbi:MAG: phage tail assembly protein [Spirochaetota bacterium]
MDREQAEVELAAMESTFDVTLSGDTRERVLKSIERDLLTFDEESEKFTLILRRPVELDNGKTVDALVIREPNTEQMQKADTGQGEFAMTVRVLGFVTGQPIGVIHRLRSRDLTAASSVLAFFG